MNYGIINIENRGKIGKVLYIDKFGNIITSIKNECFNLITGIKILENIINEKATNYQSMKKKNPAFYCGSAGFIEIGINKLNASEILKININDKIKLIY